ncbi:hypothetical protein, partial [Brachybacterium sp. Marseille-Q7125]|uniref:hypothetical protein n=1 Tax=Brachybacterium sp. Marseille-Q7125 TaxID=2932815 RepID=UPI001FF466C9
AGDMTSASGVCFAIENDVHLPGPERVEVLVMHFGDLLFQDLVALFTRGGGTVLAGVVGARSDLEPCFSQGLADRLDSELFLVLIDV